MGAAAVRGQSHTTTFTFHPSGYTTNVNFHNHHQQQQQQQQDIMACDGCKVNFTLFKRKKLCKDCGRNFCSECTHRFRDPENNRRTFRQCKKCKVLISGKFTRQELIKWKVKDLRILLNKRNVSTDTCTEKHDLIDLVFINFSKSQPTTGEEEPLSRQASSLSGSTISSFGTNVDTGSQQTTVPPTMPSAPAWSEETEEQRMERLRQRQGAEMREAEFRRQIYGDADEDETPRETTQGRIRFTLNDIEAVEEIEILSTKQLKELLVTNFVDYKGCVEKRELVDKVKRLWIENKSNTEKAKVITETNDSLNKDSVEGKSEDEICKICMDATIDCVLLECGHMISCTKCGRRLNECPVCRQYVVRVVHTFKS